jgi:DeoR/GlpR family transcriptional regulator of sugar metabolism
MDEPLESKIKQLLMHNKSETIEHLAEVLDVSVGEIRAALKKLEEQGHAIAGELLG